jgi:DNA helicase II / ATP-dependent DNA helicase PcrA
VKFSPPETLARGGRCPVCGSAMTVGVLSRVEALADRSVAEAAPPATAGAVSNLVALPEMLGEIAGSGPASKTVERGYGRLLYTLGPELDILQAVPLEDISRADSSVLAEAVARLRVGKVIRDAGYDGEYGVIRLFEPDELRRRTVGGMLFEPPPATAALFVREEGLKEAFHPSKPAQNLSTHTPISSAQGGGETQAAQGGVEAQAEPAPSVLAALDADQRAAASVVKGPLLIVAGPGSGKTRTLVHRIAHLVAECGVAGGQCLAITFTRRAAAEMRERLQAMLGPATSGIAIHTFHSLGLAMLREHAAAAGLAPGFHVAGEAERAAALAAALGLPRPRAESLIRAISKAERMEAQPSGEIAAARIAYVFLVV